MDELAFADIFLVLKPLCDNFMNEPCVEKASQMSILISRTSNRIIQKIYKIILYPLTHHLKKNTLGKDQNLKLIETIQTVLLKVRIDNLILFHEIYNCLRVQICQPKKSMDLIEAHEELKENVVLCMKDLVENSSNTVIESFYTRKNAALLSHGIYLCVKIARLEKSISLRLAALEAMMTLLQVHKEVHSGDIVLSNQIADVIMLFLPGVGSGLMEIALGTDIQNHKITMMAIKVWSRTMTLVMQDMPSEQKTSSTLDVQTILEKDRFNFDKMKHILETAKRTPEWYTAVSEKFKIIFTELDTLTNHSNIRVRKQLAEGVSLLLLNCSRNMKPCFKILFEILITLSEDENGQVASEATKSLQKIQIMCLQDETMKPAVELLEENLYELLTILPRIIRTSGESLQIVWLNRLAGYLKILGKQKLSQILLSTAHLQKLLLTLVYISELDYSNISLLKDTIQMDFENSVNCKVCSSWKQFKFLFNPEPANKLINIFKILGEYGDHQILVDSILKMTLDFPKLKKELTMILNIILEVSIDPAIQMTICKQIVEHTAGSDYWNLPIEVSDEITLQIAQANILQCCLLLESFGVIANILQEDYQAFLLKTLYLIIERAGNEHRLLHVIGLSTLANIAKSQKLDTIGDLFRVNFDYISYHVIMKLRRVERNPGVLDVIGVFTNYSTMDFLPNLKEIVDDLLLQSSSDVQKQYYNAEKNSKLYENDKETENEFDTNLLENLENDNTLNKESSRNFNEVFLSTDEKELKVPYYVNMVKDVMKRCLHFLPSQDFTESNLAISTLKEGAFILRNWENDLLPIIHELWHPLVDRFQDSNYLLINQAWQLLCCIACVSQDFIRSRTLKQIIPAILNFLKKSSKESYKKDVGSTYKYTQIFKLQKEILSQLGILVQNLKLLERDIWNILEVTALYLDCLQNLQLQEYCVNLYKEIANYNPDIVWVKCIDIWNQEVESVIATNFYTWFLEVMDSSIKSNYQSNVQQILKHIYAKREFL